MFGRTNVYAMVTAFKVRVKDARQKDRNHTVEIDFEVPLTYDLADEILPAMAKDLFHKVGNDWVPKAEILEAMFDVNPDPQQLILREHPDLDAMVTINNVTIRKVGSYRGDGGAVLLGFTVSWTLGDYEKEPAAIIRKLKSGVYLTCQPNQIDTLLEGAGAEEGTGPDAGGDQPAAGDEPQRQPTRRRARAHSLADVH